MALEETVKKIRDAAVNAGREPIPTVLQGVTKEQVRHYDVPQVERRRSSAEQAQESGTGVMPLDSRGSFTPVSSVQLRVVSRAGIAFERPTPTRPSRR